MQISANFNGIAPFYDGLCQFVFGKRVKNAQIESLSFIPANSTVLIVGGGTGWILDEINKIHPSGLTITYIDISSKMIQLSQNRNLSSHIITFINNAIENIRLPLQEYHVIITPFFLDCFSQLSVQTIFTKLDHSLKINGLWLNIDFCLSGENQRLRQAVQKAALKLMYVFFRLVCKIEANKLPSVNICFTNYTMVKTKLFYGDFIKMQVFQKNMATAIVL